MTRAGNAWGRQLKQNKRTAVRRRPDESEVEPTTSGRYFDCERDCYGRYVDGKFVPDDEKGEGSP